MQISNYSVPNFQPKAASKPSFGGNAIQELTAIIPNTKVAKNLTQLDRNAFSHYIYARKFQKGTFLDLFATNSSTFYKMRQFYVMKHSANKQLKK